MLKSYLHIFAMYILFLTFYGCGSSGSVILSEGNLNFLKGQNKINIKYIYDNISVGEMTEEAYIEENVNKKNQGKPGSGDDWLQLWKGNRGTVYQPSLEEQLNKYVKGKVEFKLNLQETKYTLVIKMLSIEPGYDVFISARPAVINAVALFVETDNPQTVLAALNLSDCKGGKATMISRLDEAYESMGIVLGEYIVNYL